MIQPFIGQPNEIIDRDIEDLVIIAIIEEHIEINARSQEIAIIEPIYLNTTNIRGGKHYPN